MINGPGNAVVRERPDAGASQEYAAGVRFVTSVMGMTAALLVRLFLDPYLGDRIPFTIFYAAVAGVAWFGGLWPAMLATVLGFLSASWFFIAPRYSIHISSAGDLVGACSYFVVSMIIALSIHAMHKARKHSLVRQLELEQGMLERQQMETALRETNSRLELLSDTASRLLMSDKPQTIVESLCTRVMEALDCQTFFNYLLDEGEGRLHLNAYAGISDEAARGIEWLDFGTAVCGCVARDGCRIVAEDIANSDDPRTRLVKGYGIQAYACNPLLSQGERVIGTLSFGSRTKTVFTTDELDLMKAVADQVANAMERIRLLTETREHAEALRHSEADLNRAQSVSQTGSWRLDMRSGELLWSDEAYRIFAIPAGTPMNYEKFISVIHPDDRESVHKAWDDALCGEPYDLEHRIISGNEIKTVRETAQLEFSAEGEIIGGFGTVQDITERKKADHALRDSEERYRELFERMQESFAIIDLIYDDSGNPVDFRYVQVNDAAARFLGKTHHELAGRPSTEIFGIPDPESVSLLAHVAQTGEPIHVERYSERVDRWYQCVNYPAGSGQIASLTSDITERKEAERREHEFEKHKMDFYRRLIEAATDGKLIISERSDIDETAGPSLGSWRIDRPEDLSVLRHGVSAQAANAGMGEVTLGRFILAVGEAATNVIKHAGSGVASLHRRGDRLLFKVSDEGLGIAALSLPEVALRTGYSTAGTLGVGYKIMIKISDKVYLATGPDGTTVGIAMEISEER